MATIVGLGGSLARTSRSRTVRLAREGAAEAGPTRSCSTSGARPAAVQLGRPRADRGRVAPDRVVPRRGRDGLGSPLYQGTVSGAFKNALDWLHLLGDRDPPYLHDKVIGLVSAAGGVHGLQAINTMEFSVRALRGWAVPYVVPVAGRAFDD